MSIEIAALKIKVISDGHRNPFEASPLCCFYIGNVTSFVEILDAVRHRMGPQYYQAIMFYQGLFSLHC